MSGKVIKILLLVEDNPGDARLLREMLNEQGSQHTELTHVEYMREAEKHLAEHTVDLILLDLGLPDAHGLAAVRRAHTVAPRVPLVVLTGMDDEMLAVTSLAGRRAGLSHQRSNRCSQPAAIAALCHRAQGHGRGPVRRKGTRPGHTQLHRRRRGLHRQPGQGHLPQPGGGKNDRLVVAGSSRPSPGPKFSESWTLPAV